MSPYGPGDANGDRGPSPPPGGPPDRPRDRSRSRNRGRRGRSRSWTPSPDRRGRSRSRSPRDRRYRDRSYSPSPPRSGSRSRYRDEDRYRGPPGHPGPMRDYPPRGDYPPYPPPRYGGYNEYPSPDDGFRGRDGPPFRGDYGPPYGDPYYRGPPPGPDRPGPPPGRRDGRRRDEGPPGVSLLIRNVSPDITTQDLQMAFGRIGEIRDVYIPRDFHSHQPKGFAFIEYADPGMAAEARAEMDRFVIKGRELEVVFAQERRKTPNEMRGRVVNQQNHRAPERRERSSSFERHKQREQKGKSADEEESPPK